MRPYSQKHHMISDRPVIFDFVSCGTVSAWGRVFMSREERHLHLKS